MKANLFDLFRDALNAVRLRFQPAEQYDYGLPVFMAVMLGVGVTHAIMMRPIFGDSMGIFAFGMVFAVLKWLLLTRALTEVLHYFGSPRIPFLGYTLATEALILPFLFFPQLPEYAFVFQLWNTWIFWAQLMGFAQISQQTLGKVFVAYVVYFVATLFFGVLILSLFTLGGYVDLSDLQNRLNHLLQAKP